MALGIPLDEVYIKRPPYVRYTHAMWRTLLLLMRSRPRVVFIQVPSLVLACYALVLSRLFRFHLICDQHNETVEPFFHTVGWYRWLCAFVIRSATLNIVTNDAMAAVVVAKGGRVAVLPDKLPCFPERAREPLGPGRHVVFICSFALDEPYVEVIEAARTLGSDVIMHITGNPRNRVLPELPANVRCTGYLPDEDYVNLLRSADAVIDLTLMDNCLVCGGYEAVALHQPLITSATAALRSYFSEAAIYCNSDRVSIATAVRYALEHSEQLRRASAVCEPRMRASWDRQKNELMVVVEGMAA